MTNPYSFPVREDVINAARTMFQAAKEVEHEQFRAVVQAVSFIALGIDPGHERTDAHKALDYINLVTRVADVEGIRSSASTAAELAENRMEDDSHSEYVDPAIEERAYAQGVEEFIAYLLGDEPTEALALVLRAGRFEGDDADENGDEPDMIERLKAVERGEIPSFGPVAVTGPNSLATPGRREPGTCHCGQPAQGPPSQYPDVCTQWPICEKKS